MGEFNIVSKTDFNEKMDDLKGAVLAGNDLSPVHTVDRNTGDGWYKGDVYVGGTGLANAKKLAKEETVDGLEDLIYGDENHADRFPVVSSYYDTSDASEISPFDIANLPQNTYTLIYNSKLTNAFGTNGIFSDCPVEFGQNEAIRIERKALRPDAPSGTASLYSFTTYRNYVFCWRSSASGQSGPSNYWFAPDKTLALPNVAADSQTVGHHLYGGDNHENRTPVVMNYYDTSSYTQENQFDLANLPQNCFIMAFNYKLTNAFETGGMFSDCPVNFSQNDAIRIERHALRPDVASVDGSIFNFFTSAVKISCWRSSGGINYWYPLPQNADFEYIEASDERYTTNGYSLISDLGLNKSVFVRGDLLGQVPVDEFTGVPVTDNYPAAKIGNNMPSEGVSYRKRVFVENQWSGEYSETIYYDGIAPSEQFWFVTKYGFMASSSQVKYYVAVNSTTNNIFIGYQKYYEPKITWRPLHPEKPRIKLAMLGDSMTYGTTADSDGPGNGSYSFFGYPYWVQKYCGESYDIEYKNIAWSGSGWLKTVRSTVRHETVPNAKTIVTEHDWNNYDVLTICLGYNDALGSGINDDIGTVDDDPSDATIGGAVNYVLNYVFNDSTYGNKNLTVILMTIPPVTAGLSGDKKTNIDAINALLAGFASKYNLPIIDMSKWANTIVLDSLVQYDNSHPTLDGYKVMGRYVAGQLKALLG